MTEGRCRPTRAFRPQALAAALLAALLWAACLAHAPANASAWAASRRARSTPGAVLVHGGGFDRPFARTRAGDQQDRPNAAARAGAREEQFDPANVPAGQRLCRFGVDAPGTIASYDVNSLRTGWYVDWNAATQPSRPGGMVYMPTIRFQQVGAEGYTYWPKGSDLAAAVAANPGSLWLAGNEPDRRYWQDSLEPRVYARAYHEVYYRIKSLDPTAQVASGSIVQPTPLRLQYLDRVLDAYRTYYGGLMPVDTWNIHAFILREASCDYYPASCWGADVPPGIDAPHGMLYEIQDNANIEIFKQFIQDFRRWMADRGYQNRPLIITEFGVQMPADYGFTASKVNDYMTEAFNYLLATSGPTGYPADGYRLVQRWAWYSLADYSFNGWLFDPATRARSVFGDNYAARTARVSPAANLATPKVSLSSQATSFPATGPVTVAVHAKIMNDGEMPTPAASVVRFYLGDPAAGGTQIGADQPLSELDGCTSARTVTVTWPNVMPGRYTIYAVADARGQVPESNEADNTGWASVLVPRYRTLLPYVPGPQ